MKHIINGNHSSALIIIIMIVALTTSCQNENNPVNSNGSCVVAWEIQSNPFVESATFSLYDNNWPTFDYSNSQVVRMHDQMILELSPQWKELLKNGQFEEGVINNQGYWIEQSAIICGFQSQPLELYNYPEVYQDLLQRSLVLSQVADPIERAIQLQFWITETIQGLRENNLVNPNYADQLEIVMNMLCDPLISGSTLTASDIKHLEEQLKTLGRLAQRSSERVFACILWSSFQNNIGLDNDPWVIVMDGLGGLAGCLATFCNPFASIIGGSYVSVLYILT